MSTAAAFHLPPAFPERAAWGTAGKLRAWQQEALDAYLGSEPRDFLAAATPGAGKTTFALRLATELLDRGHRRARSPSSRPPSTSRRQWADAAARVGIQPRPEVQQHASAGTADDYHGVAVTYAQVAVAARAAPRAAPTSRRTLVILDEVHHGGDALSWGDAHPRGVRARDAAAVADRHAVPLRHRADPVRHLRARRATASLRQLDRLHLRLRRGAARRRRAPGALHGLRRQHALAHQGRRRDGGAARRGEHQGHRPRRPGARRSTRKGEWIPAVLAAADRRLTEVRRHVAGCRRARHRHRPDPARAYAAHPRGSSPARRPRSCSPTRRRERAHRGRSRERRRAGWSPCAWCPRASTCRGSRSASTRRRPRRRCSSPRRSAASCGPAAAARPRRCSCRRSRSSSSHAAAARGAARPRARPQARPRRHRPDVGRGAEPARRGQPRRQGERRPRRGRLRGARVRRPLRPRALRQAAVRHCTPQSGSEDEEEYLGLPGPARARPGVGAAPRAAEPPGQEGAAGAPPPRCPSPRTGPWPRSARSSTSSSRRTPGRRALPHANVHMDLRRVCGGPDLAAASIRAGLASASTRSGSGSSAAADRSRYRTACSPPIGPRCRATVVRLRLGGEPRTWTRDCSDRAPDRRRTT